MAKAAKTNNLDRMIYVLIVGHANGDYFPEQNVSETDRASVVKDIAEGQYGWLQRVLELNPAENICRDVTEDIVLSVSEVWADRGEPLSDFQRAFIEEQLGFDAARSFRSAA